MNSSAIGYLGMEEVYAIKGHKGVKRGVSCGFENKT